MTASHLRFGLKPIRSPYLITRATFVACHNFTFMEKYDMLKNLEEGGSFLLTSEYDKDTVWDHLPGWVQKQIIDKKVKFYVINAIKIAEEVGLGNRVSTIMQTAFFEISKIIDEKVAIEHIKHAVEKTFKKKGEDVVKMNIASIDGAVKGIQQVSYPSKPTKPIEARRAVSGDAPDFVKDVTATIIRQEGESLPVSKIPADGVWRLPSPIKIL
ncbi:hypothetical protein R80B4_02086 [Fibrobacteres bacterium R8-0-B4]